MLQVQGNKALELDGGMKAYKTTGNIPPFKGTFDGLVKVMETQGWRQLFAGLSLNYLKVRRVHHQTLVLPNELTLWVC